MTPPAPLTLRAATLAAGVAFVTTSCVSEPEGPVEVIDPVPADLTLAVDRTSPTVGVDRIVRVAPTVRNADGQQLPDDGIVWSSSDPAIAPINPVGVVSIRGSGEATIRAELGTLVAEAALTIAARPPGGSIAIAHTDVLTMSDADLRVNQTVLVLDGAIAAVGPASSVAVPPGVEVIDGTGRVVLPGLADMHVHPQFANDLVLYVASGVTTVLDMGNGFGIESITRWRSEVREGTRLGPNIYASLMLRASSDRGVPASIADTPEQGRAAIRSNAHYDFVKVYNGLTRPTFQAVLDEAASLDMTVIGHGVRAPGMSASLEQGQKMVAHAEEFFYTSFGNTTSPPPGRIDEVGAELVAAGAYVTATLSINEAFAILWGNPPGLDELRARPGYAFLDASYKTSSWPDLAANFTSQTSGAWRSVLDFEMAFLADFHEAGVPLLLGTDSPGIPGMVPGFSLHEDLRLHVEMGLTPFEALRLGTVNAGAFVGEYLTGAEPFGRVAPGYRGDLLLVDGDPLADLDVLRRPDLVIVRGRPYAKSELDVALEALRN